MSPLKSKLAVYLAARFKQQKRLLEVSQPVDSDYEQSQINFNRSRNLQKTRSLKGRRRKYLHPKRRKSSIKPEN